MAKTCDVFTMSLSQRDWNEAIEQIANDIFRGTLEHFFGSRVEDYDTLLSVNGDHCIHCRIDQSRQSRLARAQSFFSALDPVDILNDTRGTDYCAGVLSKRRCADAHPTLATIVVGEQHFYRLRRLATQGALARPVLWRNKLVVGVVSTPAADPLGRRRRNPLRHERLHKWIADEPLALGIYESEPDRQLLHDGRKKSLAFA